MNIMRQTLETVHTHTHTCINLIDKKRVGEVSTLKVMNKNRLLFNKQNLTTNSKFKLLKNICLLNKGLFCILQEK